MKLIIILSWTLFKVRVNYLSAKFIDFWIYTKSSWLISAFLLLFVKLCDDFWLNRYSIQIQWNGQDVCSNNVDESTSLYSSMEFRGCANKHLVLLVYHISTLRVSVLDGKVQFKFAKLNIILDTIWWSMHDAIFRYLSGVRDYCLY